jgi:5-methylcytosine-specific restriction endonuclease McrA
MKNSVLKLNKYYFPIGVSDYREVIKNIFSGAVYLLDVTYVTDEFGLVDPNEIAYFEPVKSWEDWAKLEVRPYDNRIRGVKGVYRMPTVAICADYDKIKWHKVAFPTKANIWKRDNWTCCYTGQKLTKENVSVDHIIPVSRGGQDTWLNLVTAEKEVNRKKAAMTPEEAGLKLLKKPFIPKSTALTFHETRPEWLKFIPDTK